MATVTDTCHGGRGHHYGWGIGAAGIITAGAITVITIITEESSLYSLSSPIARTKARMQRCERSRPQARPVQPALNWRAWSSGEVQPNPISTAIRIRSEWFLAPSFCLSSEVVLATVL